MAARHGSAGWRRICAWTPRSLPYTHLASCGPPRRHRNARESQTSPVHRNRRPQPEAIASRDPLWYRDATIYQLHVKSFYDSNGDGIGDFQGALQKLDYIRELGTDTVWLLPFYPSPRRDDGYDISDYRSVHPDYGTHGRCRGVHRRRSMNAA